jgi:hypothetical protein
VLRFRRPVFGCDHDFPARHHFRHAEFRWCGRLLLQEARHDIDESDESVASASVSAAIIEEK